jgi:hypothetical protein
MSIAKIREATAHQDFEGACAALNEQRRICDRVYDNASFTPAQKSASRRELEQSATYLITSFFDVPIRKALVGSDLDEVARLLARMKLYCDQLSVETVALKRVTRMLLSDAYDACVPFTPRQMSIVSSILHANTAE